MKKLIIITLVLLTVTFSRGVNVMNTGDGAVFTRDFLVEIAKEKIPGHSFITKFGVNGAVGTAIEDIWDSGGVRTWATNAFPLYVFSDSAADITNGAGARKIYVSGLGENWQPINVEYELYGTSTNFSVTNKFIRVSRAYILEVGAYQTTTTAQNGDIKIYQSNVDLLMGLINSNSIGVGQTQQTHYTVPSNYTGYLLSARSQVEATKSVTLHLWQRPNANNITSEIAPRRIMTEFYGAEDSITYDLNSIVKLPQMTDIWVSGYTATGSSAVSAQFDMILIENQYVGD